MEKLVPKDPSSCTVIRKVTENILTFSAPFARFGYMKIGGRGTVVRLSSGNLAVFSPVALTDEAKKTVDAMGKVSYISALDYEHHMFIGPWHQAYPEAKTIGVEGLPEKRVKQGNEEVRFDVIFTAQNKNTQKISEEFDKEFDYEYLPMHANKELVFNHRPSRTLIQADLIFNLPAMEQYSKSSEDPQAGFLTRLFIRMNGTSGAAMGQRRFIWWLASSANRPEFNKSIGKIDGWDFDRIIPAHGDVFETGGKGVLRKIMAWNLQALEREQGSN